QTEAENLKKNKLLEAKEKFLKLQSEHDKSVSKRNKKLEENEKRARQKEQSLNQKNEQVQRKLKETEAIRGNLDKRVELLNVKRTEIDKNLQQQVKQLEKVAGMSAEEAREQMIKTLKEEAKTQAAAHVQEILEDAKLKANKEAKKIVIQTIQRTAAEHTIENTVTVFNLETDQLKGQIIGREGRNIRAIEAATGVDLIVDDTPEAIVLSCFDPLRREIARLALQRLVQDGRIHPARVEEVVNKTRKQIEEQVREIGERTVI